MLYVTDAMYNAVYEQGSAPLRDAMDLAYMTGQRPADALRISEHDVIDSDLIVTQAKTMQPLRINIAGKLANLMDRIHADKAMHRIVTAGLLTNTNGKRLAPAVLRNHFHVARGAGRCHPSEDGQGNYGVPLLRPAREGG